MNGLQKNVLRIRYVKFNSFVFKSCDDIQFLEFLFRMCKVFNIKDCMKLGVLVYILVFGGQKEVDYEFSILFYFILSFRLNCIRFKYLKR